MNKKQMSGYLRRRYIIPIISGIVSIPSSIVRVTGGPDFSLVSLLVMLAAIFACQSWATRYERAQLKNAAVNQDR